MKKGTRKNLISALITLLILLGSLFIFQKFSNQKESTLSKAPLKKELRTVKVDYFTPESATNEIEVDGRLQAYERVSISSKVTGIMQQNSADVREGKYFKKGALLYSIDDQEAIFNLQAQKSALFTTISQMMPDIKFDYPDEFQKWEKYLSEFQIDQPITAIPEATTNQEKYFIAGRNILNQYYSIKSLETRLKDYKIYAPFSGIITQSNVFPGSIISPGAALATMINTSVYEMVSPIPLDELKYIKLGQTVNLTSVELGKEWKGKVNRIGNQIDNATQNIPIYITVTGSGLKDGMYLNGELKGAELKDIIKLPKEIFLNPETIYVVKDSLVTSKNITSLKRIDNHVLVRGLNPDDAVITGSLAGLYEGQKVKI
ncbi:efflux RND transporter periplasmic adaptor subunit [Portibacter lacus]|uniref:MexH family multidrug efflux RND transporter periplasmic adaptor subunit n=1 Tax=Portibacter lacus TaxID=1099794 RepID=A0AA37SVA0_9BACT|nr:efflux RND transporter periplasmic adaptor subunit [Portibacter lacus]GLR18798.1 MexH family multidrug efflux RND transporter periplasmic adaptor subunit [Portibacter lacus]